MNASIQRRKFLTRSIGIATISSAAGLRTGAAFAQGKVVRTSGTRVKIGLNAYSFNEPLRANTMTLADVVDYCAQHGLDCLDATGYYFPGYPKVPDDKYVYSLKRRAYLNGVTIHGTGVRNNFAVTDAAARVDDVEMVKGWIEVASKLGASVIRVFTGTKVPDGYTFDQTLAWMVPLFKECAAHAALHGVIVGLQNHDGFLKTADETIRVIEAVNSEWFGSILDIGSLRQSDPYQEIERLLPYAVSWQLKESVGVGGKEVPTDLAKIKAIVDKGGYRGFMPIETLGEGDPKVKVAAFVEKVRKVFPL